MAFKVWDTSPQSVFKNNENFFLRKDELKQLMAKKAAFWKDRSVTYKNLFLKSPDYFEKLLRDSMDRLVRTDTSFDWLLLYANLERIRLLMADIDVQDTNKYKLPYEVYKPSSIDEISEILNDYRLFDTETTWFWTLDQLTQFGIGIFKDKVMRQKAEFYIEKYKANIPKPVIDLTWITNEIIEAHWKSVETVLEAIHKLIDWQTVVAHNISFDMDKITEFFVDFKCTPPKPARIIDSIDMFKLIAKTKKIDREIKNYKLDTMTKFFTWIDVKTLTERHTAMFDVSVTHNVLVKAINHGDPDLQNTDFII